jgi:uncharacterized membrane protein YqjE
VVLFSAFMAFLCLNLLVFVVFWDEHRVAAALVLSAFYLLVAIVGGLYVRRRGRTAAHPFSASLAELRKDQAAMKRADP